MTRLFVNQGCLIGPLANSAELDQTAPDQGLQCLLKHAVPIIWINTAG